MRKKWLRVGGRLEKTSKWASRIVTKKAESVVLVKWVRSGIGFPRRQKQMVRSLGLKRLNQVAKCPDTPHVRGLVARLAHLVEIVEAAPAPAWASVPEYQIGPASAPAPPEEAGSAAEAPAEAADAAEPPGASAEAIPKRWSSLKENEASEEPGRLAARKSTRSRRADKDEKS
jgi:large subunit ribosomal protein L30